MRKIYPIFVLMMLLLAPAGTPSHAAPDDPTIPPVWDIVADDFESGSLDAWNQVSAADLSLAPGGGRNGSTSLSVAVGQSERYLYQTGVAKAEEGYLTFWFDPNGVVIPDPFTWWPPGNSIRIASIVGSDTWWPPLISIYVRYETGQGYRGFITWSEGESNHYDYENDFEIANDWQKITIGYRIDEWAAVWIDDQLVRYNDTTVSHQNTYGDVIYVGKTNENSDITPIGAMRFDDVAFQVPRVDDLWVDAASGDDGNDGLTITTAFRTIQKAADLAGPGTTVHILPGVYRETVWSALSGSATEAALYVAENGPGTAVIRGSEPASELAWAQLGSNSIGLPPGVDPTNIYYTDLSTWELDGPPRFVVELDGNGDVVARLPLAHEPDWHVTTEWKHHQFWWAADGGSSVAGCDPSTDPDPNCDFDQRSLTQLTDRSDDSDPPGVEAGNLTTLGDLTGATLVAIDTLQGHYVYRRAITAHDVPAGRITVDRVCEHDGGTGNPGLGWGSKYYIEGQPYLLDTPGEWWYDEGSGRLYLWPHTAGNPATKNIEISRRDNGFSLRNRSYTTLDGLTIEFLNGSAIYLANWETHKAYGDTVRHATLRYANWGAYIEQSVRADAPTGNVIDGFTLEDSEIAHVDTHAIRLIDWWENGAAPDSFTRPGVLNTVIRDNEMHHLGFRTDGDNAVGASFTFANQLRIEGNHVHHVAHNGFQISRSVIQSPKEYGFAPDEIKTGGILIKDNLFEKACQLTTDCGALKIWGSPPDNHVFRDFLVTGNVFRDTFGWTYVSEKRGRWTGGPESEVRGLGGFGLYIDHASGVHAYRNVSYNNAYTDYMVYGRWRDGAIVYVNNVAANSLHGMSLGGGQYDTHGAVDTQVINNILINNEAFGISLSYAAGSYADTTVDYNLYDNNGWRSYEQGGIWHAGAMVVREGGSWDPYQTLADVQANTPWEDHGVAGDPVFWDYDPDDHDLHDGSWPDFHLTAASANAIDRGTTTLPDSLATLLDTFDVDDFHRGTALDVGRYEAGFAVLADPSTQAVDPGGVAHYSLRLHPPDLPHTVTLTAASPSPLLTLAFSPTVVTTDTFAILTVTDTHTGSTLLPGLWYTIPITGTGGGFTHTASVGLLVGGTRVYLPLVARDLVTLSQAERSSIASGDAPEAGAVTSLSMAVRQIGNDEASVLFQEYFDDADFASRGWYDNTNLQLSTTEHITGSTSSAEFHFYQGATTPTSGGAIRKKFPETDEIYAGYHVKYSSSWEGSNRSYHPHEFLILTNLDGDWIGPAYTHLTAYIEQNEGKPLLAIQDGQNIDESNIGVDLTDITKVRAIAGCNGDSDGYGEGDCYLAGSAHRNGKGWRAGDVYFADTPGPYYKNDWHFVEAYFKLNSISEGKGIADGVVRYWYDGQLIIDHDDVMLRTGQYPDMRFNQFMIAPWIGDGSPVDQTFWVDDLTVATSRPTAEPELALNGTPADQSIHLTWTVTGDIPPTSTWRLAYDGPAGDQPTPITGIISPTRAYTLTGLTNYTWYTVTLDSMLGSTPLLTDTVRVMPTDRFVYLPVVMRAY